MPPASSSWLFGGSYGLLRSPTRHGHAHLLRMAVQLEHHDGSQRLLHACCPEAFRCSGGSTASVRASVSRSTIHQPRPRACSSPPTERRSSGTAATLDASASNATSVEFWLFGGSYGYSGHLVGTATPTYYGWLYSWNTTTVPNGSYTLLSEAFGSGGSASSSGVSITVHN